MANEPIQGGPYPLPADSPDGPSQIKAVADWAAPRLNMRFASIAARDAAIPTPVAGMECTIGTGVSLVKYFHDGTAWRVLRSDTGEVEWTSATSPFTLTTTRSRRVADQVRLSGLISNAASVTIPTGAGVLVARVPHPPAAQQLVPVTTGVGMVEAVIDTVGDVRLRRLTGAGGAVTMAASLYVGFDGLTYRGA